MNNNNINIQIIFIGKPQWEAGWPYLGYNNDELINSILNHLNEKFPQINFNRNEMITTYDDNLVSKIREKISKADGILIFTIGHYGNPGIVKAGIEFIEMGKPVRYNYS